MHYGDQYFRLLYRGNKKPLVFDDMTDIREIDACRSIVPLFEKSWYGKVRSNDPTDRYGKLCRSTPSNASRHSRFSHYETRAFISVEAALPCQGLNPCLF